MAGKTDFTQDEWTQLQHGVAGTTLLVSLSDPGLFDSFKEAGAGAKHIVAARKESQSQVVRELAESPGIGFGLGKGPQALESETLDSLRAGAAALKAKAPDEVEAYRTFVLDVAQSVAEAAGGGVAEGETAAIEKIRSALASV